MRKPRPIDLDYATPKSDRGQFNWVRAFWLATAIFVPPVASFTWSRMGIDWMYRLPGYHTGDPWEAMYAPRFIEWPWIICTLVMAIEAVFILVIAVRRKWADDYLLLLPLAFFVWAGFSIVMWELSESVFP